MDAPDLAEPPARHEPALRAANVRPAAKGSAGRIAIFGGDIFIFRRWMVRDLLSAGWTVFALGPDDPDQARRLKALGAHYIPVSTDRTGLSPARDLTSIRALALTLRQLRPDILFSFHTKYNVVGPLAARLAGVPRSYALVAGLGYAFSPGPELKRRMVRAVLSTLLRQSLRCCAGVFVQNSDDHELVRRLGWVAPDTPIIQIPGTGVDLDEFSYAEPPPPPLRVCLIARLLREKGIFEYVETARIVKRHHPSVLFTMLGRFESNPSAVAPEQVEAWHQEGVIDYLGTCSDVRPHLRNSSVLVHASYYREGVPKIILEAMAIGRPIVACDVPGCRDAVVNGKTGLLVPPRSPEALAQAVTHLVAEPEHSAAMGIAGRQAAEACFDVRQVNARLMAAFAK